MMQLGWYHGSGPSMHEESEEIVFIPTIPTTQHPIDSCTIKKKKIKKGISLKGLFLTAMLLALKTLDG